MLQTAYQVWLNSVINLDAIIVIGMHHSKYWHKTNAVIKESIILSQKIKVKILVNYRKSKTHLVKISLILYLKQNIAMKFHFYTKLNVCLAEKVEIKQKNCDLKIM